MLCYVQCPDGYYETKDSTDKNVCAVCDTSCKRCASVSPNDCISCKSGLMHHIHDFIHICQAKCLSGFLLNTDTNECEPCLKNCDTCAPLYFLFLNTCDKDCPKNTFKNSNKWTCEYNTKPYIQFVDPPKILGLIQTYTFDVEISSIFDIKYMYWNLENERDDFKANFFATLDRNSTKLEI